MRQKRVATGTLALLLALILPAVGFVSSCGSSEADSNPEAVEQSDSGLVEEVSADDDLAEDRVARITFFDGGVSARPVGAEEWETLEVNEPIFEGYELYADDDGRAEMMLGEQKYARFGEGADVTVSRLDPEWAQFELSSGVMTLALDSWADNEYYEINSPGGAFIPQGAGSYRVDVLPSGETRIVVTRGTALVTTPQGQFTVNEGDVLTLPYDTPAQVDVVAGAAPQYYDEWDGWVDERNVYYTNAYSQYDYPEPIRAFESRNDIFGILQLAAHGLWMALDDDDDRYVWQPHAARQPGWSPYNDGYWDYTPVTGWTWISREEWGWAPYHYGRWDYRDNMGWYWAPDHGSRISNVSLYNERYAWHPAQVYVYQPPQQNRYVWVPLAPGEPFVPYTLNAYSDSNVRVVDFRPRHLVQERAVYYIEADELYRRANPRRLRKGELRQFYGFAEEQPIPFARLPRPDRVVARNEIAPERLRPRKEWRDRALVVSERALERRAKHAENRRERQQLRAERQIRKAERREMKVQRRQLRADEQVKPLRNRRGQAERMRANRPDLVELRKQRREMRREQRNDATRAERREMRQQRRELQQQQQGDVRQQRREAKQERREMRQQRQNTGKAERREQRQQRREMKQQRREARNVEKPRRNLGAVPRAEKRQQRQEARQAAKAERRDARQATKAERRANKAAKRERNRP